MKVAEYFKSSIYSISLSVIFFLSFCVSPAVIWGAEKAVENKSFSVEAWDFYYDKNFDQAIQLFTQEAKLHSDWSDPYDGLGWAYLQKGDFLAAERNFTKALKIYPYYVNSINGLTEVAAWKYRRFNRAWTYYYAGDFNSAIPVFEEILSEQNGRLPKQELWRVHLGLAWAYFGIKKYDPAIEHFNQALKFEPKSIDALKGLGFSLFEKGDFAGALEKLNKSLQIQTYQPDVQSKIGWIDNKQGNFEQALVEFEKAKQLNPYLVEPYTGLAWTYYEMKNFPKAKEFFSVAIAIYPFVADERLKKVLAERTDWKDLLQAIGWSYYNIGYYQNAITEFDSALKILGEDATVLRGLGYAYSKLGKYDQAVNFLRRSIAKNPALAPVGEFVTIPGTIATYWITSDAQSTLAWTLYYQKKYNDAVKEFDLVIKKHPDWVDVHDGLGWTYFMMKDLAKAGAAFKTALAINPSYADALNGLTAIDQSKYGQSGLGWSYYYQGNYIAALAQFKYTLKEEGSRLNKDKALSIHSGMGWSYFRLGEFNNAEKEFRTVLGEDPNHVDALAGMGYVMFERKSFADAKTYLNKAMELDAGRYDVVRALGWTYLETKDFTKAIESFKRAIGMNAYLVDPYYGMGLAYYKNGNLKEAKEIFTTAIDIYPDYVLTEQFREILEKQKDWIDIYNRLGWSYYYKGLYQKASEMFATVLEKEPSSKDALLGLGSIYFQQGDYKAAIQKLEPLLAEMPAQEKGWLKWSHVLNNLGWSYFYTVRYDKSLECFQRLIALHKADNVYAEPYSGLGWSLYKKGDIGKARQNFMKAVELLPGYLSALNGLAELDRVR
ncbi:MAG: tetratricopeptide repeat protein [Candidatus Omnitrophica bacterium]|nr:tetratricopeptide repeat protein [Candidatus Omnitrophota bacterium]